MKKAIQSIKEEFPPLIYALNLLPLKSTDSYLQVGTDKEFLMYNPHVLISEYKSGGMKRVRYLILHTVLHGLLGHWDMAGKYGAKELFEIAVDREVGHLLQELGYENEAVKDANEEISELIGECYDIGMYFRVEKNHRLKRRFTKEQFLNLLQIDNHGLWRKKKEIPKKAIGNETSSEITETGKKKSTSENDSQNEAEKSKKWENARAAFAGAGGKTNGKELAGILKASRQSGKQRGYGKGSSAGSENADVDAAKENDTSYYELLKQFLTNTKEQKATTEAIDYALYQYGLELYGDVPLIEPPDSEERLELNTICLAIDTSGSCSGEVANRFLRETYNLFRDLQSISTGGELYLFQCDTQIQKEECYERIGDLAQVMDNKKRFYGFGGTSFVPVFERIHDLEEEGKKIDCLIYLSDAYGDFPETQPEYPVFFVLDETEKRIKNDYWLKQNVPEWVTLVGIGKE